jgi:PAS domain S-box-containing protein
LRLDNVIDGVVMTFLDVSQLDKALEQQSRLATIVECSPDAIVGRTFEGIITSWNQGAASLFGYTASEAVGGHVSMIVPRDQREEMDAVHERVRKGEAIEAFETVRVDKGGKRIAVSAIVAPVRDAGGKVVAAASVFRDISDLKRAQEVLSEEARRADDFLALLSHELRNPLAPLRNCLEILNGPTRDDQRQGSIQIMERQIEQLTGLVDQLMDVSRISSGRTLLQRETLDLAKLVKAGVEDQRATLGMRGLKLEARLPEQALWVEGDPLRISQALGNLLSNAAKFTDPGGVVSVTLERDGDGRAATLAVKDTGIGMDKEFLGRLFEPFGPMRGGLRNRAGLGLGLVLVKGFMEGHGGSVKAASDGPGRGSTFTIRLPLLRAFGRPRAGRATEDGATGDSGGRVHRVLIVEDNRDVAESTRILLEHAGHTVEVAHDADSALKKAHAFRPDVVVCDIALAGEKDGFAVAAGLRQDPHAKGAYLIALTGYGRDHDRDLAHRAGFDTHLTKPADPASLKRLIAGVGGPPSK